MLTVYEYFSELSKIPRGSGNEKAASDYLAAFGHERGLYVYRDDHFNVLIRKAGSKGRENEPPVILQAHIDMVCEKNLHAEHDFSADPIVPVIKNGWVTAQKETTLGADDGSGVAYIMAILASADSSHPPIEALFTANEEAGMTGAEEFDSSLLLGRRFINIDTETEGVMTVSCAAAADVDIMFRAPCLPVPENFSAYRLTISGLAGGHSGMDIHKGLGNANVLMGRLLKKFAGTAFDISSINGGSKRNAIPRECAVVISFEEERLDFVKKTILTFESEFRSECYDADSGLSIKIEKTQTPEFILGGVAMILTQVTDMPNGVISMSPDIDGLVRTSNNLGVITTVDNIVTLSYFPRSSCAKEQAETIGVLKSFAEIYNNASIEIKNEKPAWQYRQDSPLRDKMTLVFKDMYGKDPKTEAVHAGLECGIFAGKLRDADFISIGPDIEGAHSPGERMNLSSFNRVYDYIVKVLEYI